MCIYRERLFKEVFIYEKKQSFDGVGGDGAAWDVG